MGLDFFIWFQSYSEIKTHPLITSIFFTRKKFF